MSPRVVIRLALRNLHRAPLRSALTTLGIVIGVAAVIVMVSLGAGTQQRMERLLVKLDPDLLVLHAAIPMSEWRHGESAEPRPGEGITVEDYLAIRADIGDTAMVSPRMAGIPVQVRSNGRGMDALLSGLDSSGLELLSREVLHGATFGEDEVRGSAAVCLVTESLGAHLYPGVDSLARIVRVGNQPFRIVGVVRDDPDFINHARPELGNVEVFVPYTSLLSRVDRAAVMSIVARSREVVGAGSVQKRIASVMEQRRGTRRAEFQIGLQEEALRAYTDGSRAMALLLAAIGGVSLLVGGIGIMNIMLVSVTERTREIGIRIAVGARERDILEQFIAEAVILSVGGGLAGVVLGIAATLAVARVQALEAPITPLALFGAFLSSVAVGIASGYLPAMRGARLDPVEALRTS